MVDEWCVDLSALPLLPVIWPWLEVALVRLPAPAICPATPGLEKPNQPILRPETLTLGATSGNTP